MLQNAITKVKHIKFLAQAIRRRGNGLKKLPKDSRDFDTAQLGWFGYEPKHTSLLLDIVSIKDQYPLQTCQWNATTAQKEVSEKIALSVRSLVIKGKEMGLCGKYGLSNMRSGQKVLKDWGILPEEVCPDMYKSDWTQYLNFNVNDYNDIAKKYKTKSFWKVTSMNDVYKLLDEGHALTFGMPWYSGFNQGGGFSFPWIIDKVVGWVVGGHALLLIGYDKQYHKLRVGTVQNSYGHTWGDKGKLYIEESFFVKYALKKYGCYVNLDIEKDTGKFIKQYQDRVVKGDKSNGVFLIEDNKKRPYISWDAFYSHNPLSANDLVKLITVVPQKDIDSVEEGEALTVDNSEHNEALKNLKKPFQINN